MLCAVSLLFSVLVLSFVLCFFFFFFSSRRRHTRFDCDWSSDVCSSDLLVAVAEVAGRVPHLQVEVGHARTVEHIAAFATLEDLRRVDVVDGVAEGAVAGFVGQQLRIGGSGVGVLVKNVHAVRFREGRSKGGNGGAWLEGSAQAVASSRGSTSGCGLASMRRGCSRLPSSRRGNSAIASWKVSMAACSMPAFVQ